MMYNIIYYGNIFNTKTRRAQSFFIPLCVLSVFVFIKLILCGN